MRIDGMAYLTIRPDGGGIAAIHASGVTPARRLTEWPGLLPKRGRGEEGSGTAVGQQPPPQRPAKQARPVFRILGVKPLVGQFSDLPVTEKTLAVDGGIESNTLFPQPFEIGKRSLAVDVFHRP